MINGKKEHLKLVEDPGNKATLASTDSHVGPDLEGVLEGSQAVLDALTLLR